jgi:hypothetical protein
MVWEVFASVVGWMVANTELGLYSSADVHSSFPRVSRLFLVSLHVLGFYGDASSSIFMSEKDIPSHSMFVQLFTMLAGFIRRVKLVLLRFGKEEKCTVMQYAYTIS